MKKDQIEPGMILASKWDVGWRSKYHASPNKMLMEGRQAVPVIVLAVGRYREARQGLCGIAVEETSWDSPSNVAVLRPVITRRGMTNDVWFKPTDPDCEWVPAVVTAASVIPWAEFVRRGEERDLAQMEVDAINARRRVLAEEIKARVGNREFMSPLEKIEIRENHVRLHYEMSINLDMTEDIKAMHDEWVALGEKLECRVR